MKLQELLHALLTYKQVGKGNPEIVTIESDSRAVEANSLFVCIPGYTVDDHDFAEQAVQQGAVALISEKELDVSVPVIIVRDAHRALAELANYFYHNPTKSFSLIGVTGTNGKTTVSHLIEQIHRNEQQTTGLIGTINMKIADEEFETKNTTPEPLLLQKQFAKMQESNVQTAVMEVSSHALTLGRVRGCDYDVAVFTNLTQDHLDYHGTMEEYRQAKGLLFSQLGNTYDTGRKKVAVLNADDQASEQYEQMTSAHILKYGIDNNADIMANNISFSANGTSFHLVTPEEERDVKLMLTGKFSVYNALAAIAACLSNGLSLDRILESLEQIAGVPGRFELVDEGQEFPVIVDYAHTPDSLENVLLTVKEMSKGNVFAVVGCGGDRDRTKRPLMAKIATELADTAVLTSDNPRSEDPEQILDDMVEGVSGHYIRITDRAEAIHHAVTHAVEGDVVLIAGKGHETYQIIGDQVLDFDDRQIARQAIKERKR
ncbi:UDP-N-acetylmuramoyl-L-alanyl-D-glutamate--2,6-diaminopimelate ligase [Guptibacillus hwajinpoensis]|uniref:UDP-N-acetylmuramoyl-L-alanyl-D-glutamate--2, 6-diaminopimelate ligase n=1 Tax=Guptibacillus hwajinpoensis TaxID=208199 RepID=UPI00273E45F0|nr:UDP-N-acetylmuramoyl-L-alanyl-D-glutamate--2,6-diaminopimelate ligase [Pseudalkalibacillus hwajinpoensis]WLR59667.1 UDP-N-acetylmuramoyl-L-alanyl-D-glutamate--2,6-diaminopimelate ligase [Pseudalkalibacillus hwajinpoensis]